MGPKEQKSGARKTSIHQSVQLPVSINGAPSIMFHPPWPRQRPVALPPPSRQLRDYCSPGEFRDDGKIRVGCHRSYLACAHARLLDPGAGRARKKRSEIESLLQINQLRAVRGTGYSSRIGSRVRKEGSVSSFPLPASPTKPVCTLYRHPVAGENERERGSISLTSWRPLPPTGTR